MALTATQLNTARDELVLAIASGARSVKIADMDVQYNSVNQMKQALALIDDQLNALNVTTKRTRAPRQYVATNSRGLR